MNSVKIKPIGHINFVDYYYNLKITQDLIYKAEIEVMSNVQFYTDSVKKRKVSTITEETIRQINPSKRINDKDTVNQITLDNNNELVNYKRNDGQNYEKSLYKEFNNAGFKPIRTRIPDRGIDIIGEYKGVTIYAQAKDLQSKVTAEKVQQLEGVMAGKRQSIGVLVSRSGYTREAMNIAKASSLNILLTDLNTVVNSINHMIEQLQYHKQPSIEIIGQSAEIIQTVEKDTRKVVIKNAEKVTIRG